MAATDFTAKVHKDGPDKLVFESGSRLAIGVFSSATANVGMVLKAVGTDDSGGVQLYCDDGGVAVDNLTMPLRTRYLLTVGQSGGGTQAGLYSQIKTAGSLAFTSGVIEAAYIFNQAGTITLAGGAYYLGLNVATTLAGAMIVGSGCEFAGIDINIAGPGAITNTAAASAALFIRSSGTPVWPNGIQIASAGCLVGIKVGAIPILFDFATAGNSGFLVTKTTLAADATGGYTILCTTPAGSGYINVHTTGGS